MKRINSKKKVRRGRERFDLLVVSVCIILFVWVVVKSAWISDDAYVTFRTIDNFLNGHGLRWNVAERVQSYTHPLWMVIVSVIYFFTRDLYYSSIIISIIISMSAVTIFSFKIAHSTMTAILGIMIFIFSKAFIDYSTSGLDNPLTHFITALFFWIYFTRPDSQKKLFMLSIICSAAMVNRLDTGLIFLPSLAYCLIKQTVLVKAKHRDKIRLAKVVAVLIMGLAPIIIWELFAIFYYGFLFPNTYYSKLNTGISHADLAIQSINYLIESLDSDPLTLIVIFFSIIIIVGKRDWNLIPPVGGIVLYLMYIVYIGGDFMSGRFLTTPLFCAVILISRVDLKLSKLSCMTAFLIVLIVGISAKHPPIFSGEDYNVKGSDFMFSKTKGIADERGVYYEYTGLLMVMKKGFTHPWVYEGLNARSGSQRVVVKTAYGMFGFYAGPGVYIVDVYGLSDPLLARLPVRDSKNWRIGHFDRNVPEGYVETLNSGENVIKDKNLALYYDKMTVITRGELLDFNRLVEIWNMNTGKYNHLIYAYINQTIE